MTRAWTFPLESLESGGNSASPCRPDTPLVTHPRVTGDFDLALTLAQQRDSGHDYHQLKPAIGIHRLDFDPITAPPTSRRRSGASDGAIATSPPRN